MLIYSKDKLQNPIGVNTIMLEDKEGHYYFTHRTLYDQAVVVKHTYNSNAPMLLYVLGVEAPAVPEIVQYFTDNAPDPINALGPFLTLITDYNKLPKDMRTLCGVLHVISRQISLLSYLKVDPTLRASVTFSLSITEEFEIDYERFFQESITTHITVASKDAGDTVTTAIAEESEDTDEFDSPAVDMSEVAEFRKMLEERSSSKASAPTPQPVVKSGFDALRGL